MESKINITSIIAVTMCLLAACSTDSGNSDPDTDAGQGSDSGMSVDSGHDAGSQQPGPVNHVSVPQHPFLAPNGLSNMHNDAYMTDTYETGGPLNQDPQVTIKSYADGPNTVSTITFDSEGRIILTSASMQNYSILMLDPDSMDVIAQYALPPRDTDDPLYPFGDTSGAAYFVLDADDRVLFTDADNAIQIIRYSDEKGEFEQLERFDLSDHVVPLTAPAMDHVQMTMPDWKSEYLWFTTRYGIVGTVEEQSGSIRTIELEGEEIQNSFAVGEDGVYIISDHAMYRFSPDQEGTPQEDWSFQYDRGSRIKPSNFNRGSGTTPQLFGDLVAISDNAEPRMNILFLKRSDGTEVCRIPVFDDGKSTTENALPGLAREGENGLEYSVIVDNNYGIERDSIFLEGRSWKNHAGGLVRVDLLPDGTGGFECTQVWRSSEKSSQVLPKLSLETGLLYVYTYEVLDDGEYTWFLTAVNFKNGETVFSIPTGKGLEYANFGPPMIMSPEGAVYLGTMQGMLRVKDN